MEQVSNGQLGLWIACLGAFLILAMGLLTVFRLLTKNFVTEERMKNALLTVERNIEKGVELTRHAIRNEFNNSFLKLDGQLDDIKNDHTIFRESLARIEGALGAPGNNK